MKNSSFLFLRLDQRSKKMSEEAFFSGFSVHNFASAILFICQIGTFKMMKNPP